jgi:hypothetical protein
MKKSFTRLRRKPRLPVLRSSLLRRMDQAVGLHRAHHDVDGYVLPVPRKNVKTYRRIARTTHSNPATAPPVVIVT